MAEKLKILVTGATGFVGGAIVEELKKAENYEIFGLSRESGKPLDSINFKNIKGDVADFSTLRKLLEQKRTDVLIHSAGLAHQFGKTGAEDFRRVNVRGTENICRMAEWLETRHFILISSVAVYGDHGNASVDEGFVCQPFGGYAESKLEAENRSIELCEKNGIRLTILRLATVIGEGDRGNTARLITLINNKRFIWVGSGLNKKSLIYKGDAGKAVLKVIEAPNRDGTQIYNLTGETVSMKEIVGAISQSLNKKMPEWRVPEGIFRNLFRINDRTFRWEFLQRTGNTFEKWLSDDIFAGRKFRETFGFRTPTPISEALERQVQYFLRKRE